MMSQMEERAKRLQSKVQQLCEGRFELRATKWGTAEELSQIVSGNTRYHELGIILFENRDGDVIFLAPLGSYQTHSLNILKQRL